MAGKWLSCLVITVMWLLCYHCDNSNGDSANGDAKCKIMFTSGYGYRQFYHMPESSIHQPNGDLLFMKFKVKARSDAHVLLSSTPSPEELDPVYEIVLGAGKNSFSDIRRRCRSNTMSSAYTKDILSGTELKGFWVKITQHGVIQVGIEQQDLPFLSWQDSDPLHIKYFSFCTWSGVAGKWLYDCSLDNQTESVVVQPTLTTTEKLRRALLTDYDVYSRPVYNASQLLNINIQIQANHIQIDAKKSVMTVGCKFTLEWYDEKMVWDPDKFNNLSMLYLGHHEIWQPQLVHFNAVGKGVSVLGREGMQVSVDGQVRWSSRSLLQTRCLLDLRLWPWDTQSCSIQLGFWNEADTIKLILLDNGTKLELQNTSSEWTVVELGAESVIVTRPWITDSTPFSSDDSDNTDNTLTALTFTFTVKRVNKGVMYILVIPILVMVVMSLTCFWMDPLGLEKLSTNCLLLLLLSAFLLSLEKSLPAPADHTPYLFKAYSWVLAVVACATVVTVSITSLMKILHLRQLPKPFYAVLTSQFMVTLFCLPMSEQKTQDNYGHLNERSDCLSLVSDSGANLTSTHPDLNSDTQFSWCLLAIFCDRIAFIAALIAYTAIFVF